MPRFVGIDWSDRGDAYLLADLLRTDGHRFRALRLAAFLARHRYSGRRPASALLARLRSAPPGLAAEHTADAKAEAVRALVAERARARGCDPPYAVRILARAWVRVLYRCWTDGRPYDPALHRAAKELKIAVRRARG